MLKDYYLQRRDNEQPVVCSGLFVSDWDCYTP